MFCFFSSTTRDCSYSITLPSIVNSIVKLGLKLNSIIYFDIHFYYYYYLKIQDFLSQTQLKNRSIFL